MHGVLRDGIRRGIVAPDADLEAVDALLFGAVLARAALGEPVDEAWIERVIAQAWQGIAAVPPAAASPGTTRIPSARTGTIP